MSEYSCPVRGQVQKTVPYIAHLANHTAEARVLKMLILKTGFIRTSLIGLRKPASRKPCRTPNTPNSKAPKTRKPSTGQMQPRARIESVATNPQVEDAHDLCRLG